MMAEAAEHGARHTAGTLSAILLAGVAAAVVDAAYFSIGALLKGQSPVQALQGIAGFWLGQPAATGGAWSATLGAATHLGLAIIMAAGFALLRQHLPFLRSSIVPVGLLYGALLYVVMYGIVLPLRWPQLFPAFQGWTSVFDILIHVAVGVTIAFVFNRGRSRSPLS